MRASLIGMAVLLLGCSKPAEPNRLQIAERRLDMAIKADNHADRCRYAQEIAGLWAEAGDQRKYEQSSAMARIFCSD